MARKKAWYTRGGAKRLTEIAVVLIKHGFFDIGYKLHLPGFARLFQVSRYQKENDWISLPTPERTRMVFEDLGPTFIKLGQMLSLRSDIIPEEFVEEFKKLQDQVPPVSYKEIEKVITSELKLPVSEIFQEFDVNAWAAASVAQVHIAELFSGEKAAVKIVRPGIKKTIKKDIRIMYRAAELLTQHSEVAEMFDPVEVVAEFENTIFKELDMYIEASNIDRCARNFRDIPEVRLPGIYWKNLSKSVLVTEYIEGFGTDDIEEMKKRGIQPSDISRIGFQCFAKQIMEDGFFHGDPHPGNAIVTPEGKMALVDFGIVGYLNDKMMRHIASIFLGYSEHNYDRLIKTFARMRLIDEEKVDLSGFADDLFEVSEPFYGRDLDQISMQDIFDRVIYMSRKYHIKLPRNLLLLFKTMLQMESVGRRLDPSANMLQTARPYAKNLLGKGQDPKNLMYGFQEDLSNYMRAHMEMPVQTQRVIRKLAEGDVTIRTKIAGLETIDKDIGRGINRLTMGIVISASLIAAAMVLNSSEKLESVLPMLGLDSSVNLTHLLGIAGYLLATLFGVWLTISIIRSS
ncbi:MAG: ABC1 kinase family protein [bacterium]